MKNGKAFPPCHFVVDLLTGPVRREHRIHPRVLSRRELIHAGIVRVIHEVLDRVEAGVPFPAAGIAALRAAIGWRALGGCIAYTVAAAGASTLKRVIEAHPVPDFVRCRVTFVVRVRGTARKRRVQHHDSIH